MASSLTATTLQISGTQSITGISATLNNSNSEVPTSAAVIAYMLSNNLLHKVGGIIYYINSSSTNTYTFYDANGNQVSAPVVGSDYTNYYYTRTGTSVDKYYVYNTSAMFPRNRNGRELNPYITWTYVGARNQSFLDSTTYVSGLPSGKKEYEYYGHGGRVCETISNGTAIGTGRANTLNMMSLRGGVYIQGAERRAGTDKWCETIWSICNLFNKGLYNLNGAPIFNTTGCNDWYVPSKDELGTMGNAIGANTFANMLSSGSVSFVAAYSSNPSTELLYAWVWEWSTTENGMSNGYLRVDNPGSTNPGEAGTFALALTRSF